MQSLYGFLMKEKERKKSEEKDQRQEEKRKYNELTAFNS